MRNISLFLQDIQNVFGWNKNYNYSGNQYFINIFFLKVNKLKIRIYQYKKINVPNMYIVHYLYNITIAEITKKINPRISKI